MHSIHGTRGLAGGLTLAAVLASALSPGAALAQAERPVTLRFAVEDAGDQIGHPYINLFIENVSRLSDGTISIEPAYDTDGWDATESPLTDLEQIRSRPFGNEEVIRRVADGEAELGLARAGSLGFDTLGVKSIEALSVPYLIDDLGLAFAVAHDKVADEALAGLKDVGLTGLGILPRDLWHPFSWTGGPLRSVEDYAGASIRAMPSRIAWDLIEALGATPWYMNRFDWTQLPGAIKGIEVGLRSYGALGDDPTATGNVTPMARLEVLFISSAAMDQLSGAQQQTLRDAAAVTLAQVEAEHPTEAVSAQEWCNQGHSVVLATPEQLAGLQAAAAPVIASIVADPGTARIVDEIRALKQTVTPWDAAQACRAVSQATPAPVDLTGTHGEAIPNGAYRAEATVEVLMQAGAERGWAVRNAGTTTWTFEDGTVMVVVNGGVPCQGTATVVDGGIELHTASTEPCGLDGVVRWRPTEDGIRMILVPSSYTDIDAVSYAAWLGLDWVRVE